MRWRISDWQCQQGSSQGALRSTRGRHPRLLNSIQIQIQIQTQIQMQIQTLISDWQCQQGSSEGALRSTGGRHYQYWSWQHKLRQWSLWFIPKNQDHSAKMLPQRGGIGIWLQHHRKIRYLTRRSASSRVRFWICLCCLKVEFQILPLRISMFAINTHLRPNLYLNARNIFEHSNICDKYIYFKIRLNII